MDELKYTHSQLSSCSVGRLIASHYDLSEAYRCKFYTRGLHDNYIVESDQDKYILRVYRNDWRTLEEIHFELDLLAFLNTKGTLAASPLLTKSGELCFIIDSPEGEKAAALFYYADGSAPGIGISAEQAVLLGKTIATLHQISEPFETSHKRQVLDIPYLLDDSILAIEPFIDIKARKYLNTLQNSLKDALPSLSHEAGVYGICTGDVNPTNFHINDNNEITLFDFDQCGYGYRAFEIGKFISSIHPMKTKPRISKAFTDGYQQVRRLTQDEIYAIPYFEIISVIWVMAIHTYNVDHIGYKYLEKPFWDRRLAIVKELDKLATHKQD